MKIKIAIPPSPLVENNIDPAPHFSSELKLRITDLNYGNHMGNDTVLGLVHEFRVQFFNHFKQSELSFFERAIIMSDSAIQYRSQGFWNQLIHANIWFIPCSDTRFDLYYQLYSNDPIKNKPKDVALIKTGQVFFDYEKQRVAPPSEKSLDMYNTFKKTLGVNSL